MDDQQNLKPELKEIYERIMKTTPSQTQSPPPPQTPPQPSTQTAPPLTSQTPPTSQNQTPFGESTEIPTSYSSVSPRPLRDSDSSAYVYSANRNISGEIPLKSPPPPSVAQTKPEEVNIPVNQAKKSGGHGVIVFISVLLFFVVYTVFWLIFFGVINTVSLGFELPFKLPF